MSKLISHIQKHQTGRRFAKPSGPVRYSELVSIEDLSRELQPHLIEYSIHATVGACVRIDQSLPSGLERSSDVMARAIEQEVFGEFREDFVKISRALWECDVERAKELLEDMRNRMFSA